jgi:hypothetical protein
MSLLRITFTWKIFIIFIIIKQLKLQLLKATCNCALQIYQCEIDLKYHFRLTQGERVRIRTTVWTKFS